MIKKIQKNYTVTAASKALSVSRQRKAEQTKKLS